MKLFYLMLDQSFLSVGTKEDMNEPNKIVCDREISETSTKGNKWDDLSCMACVKSIKGMFHSVFLVVIRGVTNARYIRRYNILRFAFEEDGTMAHLKKIKRI